MRVRVLLLCSVYSLLVAGCVAPTGEESPSDAPDVPVPGAVVPVVWTACEQWHLHFDARAEDFADDVPPGFTITADDLGMTTLLIHVTLCGDTEEAVLALPVSAPAEHDDAERMEVAVLQVFHSPTVTDIYPPPFTSRLVPAEFARMETPTGPLLRITGGEELTELALVLNPSSGEFGAEHWIRFAADDSGLGVLIADGAPSTNVGFGPVGYRHEGPGGAPPATAGIAHVVSGLEITFTSEVRP